MDLARLDGNTQVSTQTLIWQIIITYFCDFQLIFHVAACEWEWGVKRAKGWGHEGDVQWEGEGQKAVTSTGWMEGKGGLRNDAYNHTLLM